MLHLASNRASKRNVAMLLIVLTLMVVLGYWFRPDTHIAFENIGAGSAIADDGGRTSFSTHKSLDGETVRTELDVRESSEKAQQRLEYYSKRATRIIERKPKFDASGKQVGERVVVEFPNGLSCVMWTNGERLRYITSRSLKHALEYERQFQKALDAPLPNFEEDRKVRPASQ